VVSNGSGKTDYGPTLEALKAYVEQHLAEYGLPGMTVGVADQDGFVATLTAGWADIDLQQPVTPAHYFQIGSISKSMTALAIFRLAEAGKLDLDAPAAGLLPGIPLPATSFTVAQLLNHSTGLPDDAPFFPRGGDERLWLGFAPGSKMSYSNTGYGLLGMILERIEQRPFHEIIEQQVFQPLGMTGARAILAVENKPDYATGYRGYLTDRPYPRRGKLGAAPWSDFAEASGSVGATGAIMARYARYLIDVGQGRGGPLFSDALAKRYATATIDAPVFGPKARYANGLATVPVNGRTLLHHTGGMIAFSSSIHVDPEAGVAGFASTNVMIGDYRPRDVTAFACMAMLAARQRQPLPAPPPTPPAELVDNAASFTGRFASARGETIEFRPQGDRLNLAFDGQQAVLQRTGPDQFLVLHPKFSLHPLDVERQNGAISRVWWGSTAYAADASKLPAPSPASVTALAGRYDNESPWLGTLRLVAREDKLCADGGGAMEQQADGSWRMPGADTERFSFDAIYDGQAQRLTFSGVDFLRKPDVA
jgi:CubicO group peptidase (beta-lactamase class C family)